MRKWLLFCILIVLTGCLENHIHSQKFPLGHRAKQNPVTGKVELVYGNWFTNFLGSAVNNIGILGGAGIGGTGLLGMAAIFIRRSMASKLAESDARMAAEKRMNDAQIAASNRWMEGMPEENKKDYIDHMRQVHVEHGVYQDIKEKVNTNA